MGPNAEPAGQGDANLFTIRAERPFLPALADAILRDELGLGLDPADPAALARLTVFLPTRRASRALASVLVARSGRSALILPRIVPLGDPAEAEVDDLLANPGVLGAGEGRPPIDAMARQLLLAYQVRAASLAHRRAGGSARGFLAAETLGAAYRMAGDLAAILDAMQAEGVPYERLTTLDATRFDEHWRLTGQLLAILGETWPILLEARGEVDPIAWRNGLLDAERRRLTRPEAVDPVLIAGSTGSMPATARLIRAIARRPRGAVVLRDLAVDSGPELWSALAEAAGGGRDRAASHPQAQLARLLAEIGVTASEVRPLGEGPPALAARRRLANEALLPAGLTESWRSLAERLPAAENLRAMAGVTVCEAADEREEGLACAIAIRQALAETEGSVALVTPDRGLAERVTLELARWGIRVDDSAGLPLSRTLAGRILVALVDMAARGVTAQRVLSLLAHPAIRLGFEPGLLHRLRQAIEIGALRGVRLEPGMAGILAAVEAMDRRRVERRAPGPRRRLTLEDCRDSALLARRLARALSQWLELPPDADLAERAVTLRRALADLTRDADGEEHAFSGEDGAELAQLFEDFAANGAGVTATFEDIAAIIRCEAQGRVVRPRVAAHPRVAILGLLEARLMSPDRMILGGLNEAAWPPQATTDAFLNRGMRVEIGLSSPERRIGQSAHDFIEALCAPDTVLTRSVKSAGVQTIPSRFWQRLKAVAAPEAWTGAMQRGARLLAWARLADRPGETIRISRPAPRPPAELQPTRFSVTEVETLYRDPYAIFARHVLKLDPVEPRELELGAADRGMLLHEVMERFALAWPSALPANPEAKLLRIGEEVFAPHRGEPDVEAFWWPRFLSLAPDLARWEAGRREGLRRIGVEVRIGWNVDLPGGGSVRLDARADRVELMEDGSVRIVDFKSGSAPSQKQIEKGFAPQLVLEAALASRAPFISGVTEAEFGPGPVAGAEYVFLKPGEEAMRSQEAVKSEPLPDLAEKHLAGFAAMIEALRQRERPFVSRLAPEFIRHVGDYDHLARVKEWTLPGDGEQGEEQ